MGCGSGGGAERAAGAAGGEGSRGWRRLGALLAGTYLLALHGGARADALDGGAPGSETLEPGTSLPTGPGSPVPAVPFEIGGERVEPGSRHRLSIVASESFAGTPVAIPIVVIHGARPGPAVCLTAGIHGDEVNGVEVVRRAVERIPADRLRGTVLAIPIVNLHGYRRASRYLPDRRDLNRYFPGRVRGSAASRIARVVFDQVVTRCDFLLDFHTGSFQRVNLPHVRGDLANPGVRALVDGLGGWLVLDHPGAAGTLRRAASQAQVPAITFEVGAPYRMEPEAVSRGLEGLEAVLAQLDMNGRPVSGRPEIVERSHWVRVDDGGLLFTEVGLGHAVQAGELLGVVIDPISNQRSEIRAPRRGRVIGMAWSQVVIPGFAAFHLGFVGDADGVDGRGEPHTPDDPHDPSDDLDSAEPDDRPE